MHNHIIFYTMSDMNHVHIIPFNPTKWTISILSMRGFHFSFIASSRMLSSPPYYLFKIMRIYGLRRQFIWTFLFMFKPPKMTLMSAFPLLLQLVCSLRQTLITPSPTPHMVSSILWYFFVSSCSSTFKFNDEHSRPNGLMEEKTIVN